MQFNDPLVLPGVRHIINFISVWKTGTALPYYFKMLYSSRWTCRTCCATPGSTRPLSFYFGHVVWSSWLCQMLAVPSDVQSTLNLLSLFSSSDILKTKLLSSLLYFCISSACLHIWCTYSSKRFPILSSEGSIDSTSVTLGKHSSSDINFLYSSLYCWVSSLPSSNICLLLILAFLFLAVQVHSMLCNSFIVVYPWRLEDSNYFCKWY